MFVVKSIVIQIIGFGYGFSLQSSISGYNPYTPFTFASYQYIKVGILPHRSC